MEKWEWRVYIFIPTSPQCILKAQIWSSSILYAKIGLRYLPDQSIYFNIGDSSYTIFAQ